MVETKKNSIDCLTAPCTGCGACVAMCPTGAIKVSLDGEGFYTAGVDASLCVGCGKCTKVCLRAGVSGANALTQGAMIAAQSKSAEVVRGCTSGGIAHEMSRFAIERGMVVAGVIYEYSSNTAKTVLARTLDEIEAFRGSKYIQSESSEAFGQLVQDALEHPEQEYLVFGTPCQIYGLASLLEQKKIRERFVLVDLFCHGVPSYLVWHSYLDTLKVALGDGPLNQIVFRDKTIGWHNFVMRLTGPGASYRQPSEGDLYYHAFFDNVLFSKACFQCEVRMNSSKADLRLGDYWGKRYQHRDDGVSAVLLLTQRGTEFFQSVPSVLVIDKTPVEEVLQGQSVHPYTTLPMREQAIRELRDSGNLKRTVRHYRRRFPLKKRAKLIIKEGTAHLPDGLRAVLRKAYKKI